MAGYQQIVRLIQDGDNVDASTIDRILATLGSNIDFVRSLLQQALLGQALFERCVTLETDAVVGMPVYYNPANLRYERALAQVVADPSGNLVTSASSQVWGIVAFKHNSTLGDIVTAGVTQLDLSAATGTANPQEPGLYYLSGTTPGGLVQQEPAVSIPVLMTDGLGKILVHTTLDNLPESHKHYKYPLKCIPAGTTNQPSMGDIHVITAPDTSIEGWLPANHASFNGFAPPNAAFGYNLAASPLGGIWPPLPIQSAYLEWDKALSQDVGGTGVPLGPLGMVMIDIHGIWWLSDCYGNVPWPLDYNSADPPSPDTSLESTQDLCPHEFAMLLTLYFTKMVFQTNSSVVTSLTPLSPRLKVLCAQTMEPGSTGPLLIDLDLGFTVTTLNQTGSIVLKQFADNEFLAGPVVEGLVAGENITLTSTLPTDNLQQGIVTVNANLVVDGYELPVSIIALEGAREERFGDTIGIEFTAGKSYAYRGQINVPATTVPGGTTMKLRFRMLAQGSGAFPTMTVTYRRLPAAAVGTNVALPGSDASLVFSPGVTLVNGSYVDVETAAFAIVAGDTVLFTLSRDSSASGPTVQDTRRGAVLIAGS